MGRIEMWSVLFFLGLISFETAQSGYASGSGSGSGQGSGSGPGYGDMTCESGNICHNGGSCVTENDGNDWCSCFYGYSGTSCEIPPVGSQGYSSGYSPCVDGMVCYNGGTCARDDATAFEWCMCTPDKTGMSCEMNNTGGYSDMYGPCESGICQYGGTCHDNGYWTCNCQDGKSGTFCEIDMPDMAVSCANTQCETNSGNCSDDGFGSWWCSCPPTKTGYFCETDVPDMTGTCALSATDAALHECESNNGTCSDDYSGNWYCSCPPGRSGMLCEITMPDWDATCAMMNAAGQACQSGGTCEDMQSHWCTCPNGRHGLHCEYEGGGSSGSGGWGGTGSGGWGCPAGWIGNNCEMEDTCTYNVAPSRENLSSWFPTRSDTKPGCTTIEDGSGLEISDLAYDACSYNAQVCQNGGSCEPRPKQKFKCRCQPGFYGEKCKEEIGPNELKLEVEGCDKLLEMVEGVELTIGEYCYDGVVPFSVRAIGMQDGTEYVIQGIRVYNDVELSPVPENTFTYSAGDSDDITHFVSSLMLEAPPEYRNGDGRRVCNNNDVFLSWRMQTTSETNPKVINETEQLRVMVVCNTAGVNVALKSNMSTMYYLNVINSDTTSKSMAPTLQQVLDRDYSTMRFLVESTDDFPLLGHDADYKVVAFLTKQNVMEPSACAASAAIEQPVPNLTIPDYFLGYVSFKDPMGLDIDAELKDIQLYVGPNEICGTYKLVILIDALVSIPNEHDRCNNYVVMEVDFGTCDEKPRCRVIPNPFENGYDSAITFQQQHDMHDDEPESRIFKFEDYMQWREEQRGDPFSNQEKIYKAMKMEYARLNMLRAEIKAKINQDPSLCTDLTKEVIEGLEDDPDADDYYDPVRDMIGHYNDSLEILAELKSETKDSDTARSEAKVLAEGITDPADSSDDAESSRRWLAKAAFSAVVNISAAIRDGKEMEYKRKARSQLCRIGEKIATLVELKKKKDEAKPLAATYPSALAPLNAAMKEQISNITSSMININMYYANARFYKCLNKMFSHAVKFTIGDIDDEDWLYDEKCGTKDNSCFRKVKAVCSSHDDDCDGETNFTDDKELCVMRLFNKMMVDQGRALLLHDIRQLLREYKQAQNEDEGRKGRCNGEEHITPKPGPVQLTKMVNGTIYAGQPHFNKDIDTICWKPIGVCTCEECPATLDGTGYYGSGGTGGYTGGYSGGTGGYTGGGGYSSGGYSGSGGHSGSSGYGRK